jgi:DNA-binding response OmpR family regulator
MGALIIVVSADERALRGTEALLTEHGYLVGTASSFVEGHDLLDSVTPDLLIADLHLDEFNGLQFAIHCHLHHRHVPVVITSARLDTIAEREAKRYGAVFITAPLENSAFLPCVRTALARRAPAQKPMRRWFRSAVADVVPVHAASGRAQIVDMSHRGVRLVFGGPRVIPATFEIKLPRGGVTVRARCVWTRSAADGQFYCGAELAEHSAAWREFVDALQGLRTGRVAVPKPATRIS